MYRYRCGQCRTTSPIVGTWVEVLRERDRHRRLFHGGHRPDGEQLLVRRRPPVRPGPVVAVAVLIVILLLVAH